MGSKWRKAKVALGMNFCVYVPRSRGEDEATSVDDSVVRFSDCSAVSSAGAAAKGDLDPPPKMPTTPMPSSSGLRLGKGGSRSAEKACSICLGTMKAGHGHALFTAECSHVFHFRCIASSVKHGNQICPVCRAKWKEIPIDVPPSLDTNVRTRINPVGLSQDDAWMSILSRLPPRSNSSRQMSLFHAFEPAIFNDDEHLDPQPSLPDKLTSMLGETSQAKGVEIKAYPEFTDVARSKSPKDFSVLIHLKASFTASNQNSSGSISAFPTTNSTSRAPVDLVTVLDVSGSMAGTKLALLKRAMGFVIQNLGPSDRLSVIAFSSTARRLFHLSRMSESGRMQALQAVNSLVASGGTNIAEGLRKGAKVIEDRREKNPVCSIILLSDGQDTYNFSVTGAPSPDPQPDYKSLLPSCTRAGADSYTPVHAFGFGMDHDAASMHSISETSGGTFSFIEAEGVIQDAFAQCIGGLLSVVVQGLQVRIEKTEPGARISSVKAGSYKSQVSSDGQSGSIEVGDLYADEERNFLVTLDVPVGHGDATSLMKILCSYKDTVFKDKLHLEEVEVRIQRPVNVGSLSVSVEVDRQRNRLQAAEAMAEARASAEQGDLSTAVSILETRRRALAETASARSGDQLCVALDAELKEMQERMASRRVYESSGRAYVLSGLSSHSWQRATARGDSTDSFSLLQAYQTPSMANMLARSHMTGPAASSNHVPPVRPPRAFSLQPKPR